MSPVIIKSSIYGNVSSLNEEPGLVESHPTSESFIGHCAIPDKHIIRSKIYKSIYNADLNLDIDEIVRDNMKANHTYYNSIELPHHVETSDAYVDNIRLVMGQTGCDYNSAFEALSIYDCPIDAICHISYSIGTMDTEAEIEPAAEIEAEAPQGL